MSKLLLVPLMAFAWLGYAQTTTIDVPQGSGVFPTIGQVNCLEESGSGRYCAATYECSGGVSGELWGDLANHDGRRAIGATSPVANGRDCVITVDGRAAVRWLTGYRPGGRAGELVGLTTSEDALRPVQRVERQGGEGGARLIYWLFDTYTDIADLPNSWQEVEDRVCGHIRQTHSDYATCVRNVARSVARLLSVEDIAATRCMAARDVDGYLDGHCPWPVCNDHYHPFDNVIQYILGIDPRDGRFRGNPPWITGSLTVVGGQRTTSWSLTSISELRCADEINEYLQEHGLELYIDDIDRTVVRARFRY